MNGLSIRTSVNATKKSRSPDILDLDTDSDRINRKAKLVEPRRKSIPLSSTLKSAVKDVQLSTPHRPQKDSPAKFNKAEFEYDISGYQFLEQTPQPQPPLSRKQIVRVLLPPSPAQRASRQKEIIQKLKHDVSYIAENSKEVHDVTGVRPFDDKDNKQKAYEKFAQKKHQPPIDRSDIPLDFSTLSLCNQTAAPATGTLSFVHPRKQIRNSERFKHQGAAPITLERHTGSRALHGKFQFVSNYVFRRGVASRSQTPHPSRSCHCAYGVCGPDCSCLNSQIKVKTEDVEHLFRVRSYQRHRERRDLIVLADEFIEDSTHTAKIFECGDSCGCSSNCLNRVVQNGRTIPLQIFDTKKYGFGVRSPVPILRGQFVDIYLGEVLTETETSRREAAAEEDTPSYIMSLDAFLMDEKSIFYIDGENFGTVTRFVNHSCEPNCKIIPVVPPRGTKHIYYVAFFAIKDIPAGTELTIDYDPDIHSEEDITDDVVLCKCGSSKCRKRLWAPGKEKRGRKKFLPSKYDN